MFQMKDPAVRRTYAAMVFDGLCASSGSVILPLLRQQYGLPYDMAGMLLAFLSVGNLAAALLLGFLPRLWGLRRSMLVLTCGMAAGYLLLAGSGAPALLLAGFLLIGMGKGSSMNYASVLVGNAAADRTKSLNLLNAIFSTGGVVAPFLYMAFTAGSLPWRAPILALAVSGALLWVLFATAGCDRAAAAGKPEKQDLSFLRQRHFWYSTALLFCQQCAEISVLGWLVTYFKDQGILQGILSEMSVTVVWTAMLLARLYIAFVLPATSRLRSLVLMSAASLVAYAGMMMVQSGPAAMVLLFAFGVVEAGVYPTVIAQANTGLNNAVMGVLLPVAGIGAILMPYGIGAVAQVAGIRGGMLCPVAALAGMLVFALLLRSEKKHRPVPDGCRREMHRQTPQQK